MYELHSRELMHRQRFVRLSRWGTIGSESIMFARMLNITRDV